MNKEPIPISFANQKGGIGKSTLTILAVAFFAGRSPPKYGMTNTGIDNTIN